MEAYDLDPAADSRLANISTRGLSEGGANVLIGGFILGARNGAAKVIVRAIGPSLMQSGVSNALDDPTLELHNADGVLIMADDNWQDNPDQAFQLTASGIAPKNNLESAIAASLPAGAYTAIVTGKNGGTGIGLVEVYNIP